MVRHYATGRRLLLVAAVWLPLSGCGDGGAGLGSAGSPATTTVDGSTTSSSQNPIDNSTDSVPVVEPDEPAGGASDGSAVGDFADRVGARLVLARIAPDAIVVWNDGSMIELAVGDADSVRSDGRFLYRWVGEGGRTLESTASTLDGTVVCEADGPIRHVTGRDVGSYVMAVELDYDSFPDDAGQSGEYGVPLEAVDCRTGDRQAIESVSFFGGDGETRFIERIGDRVFTGFGDAEGNAEIVNEQGLSINGDDYAGYHTFNEDGSRVVYGDMGVAGPHFSPVIRSRDTTTGAELWTVEFDVPFRSLFYLGRRVAVTFAENDAALIEGDPLTARAVVLDGDTGGRLVEADVGLDLVFVG